MSELDVPEGVRLVISRRLERVSEACRTALTDAAVVGRDFSFELLQALTDLEADAILDAVDEAERANLIVAGTEGTGEARFSFTHELIRQTLISGLSLPRRQRLHLRVAEAVERVYGQEAEANAADMGHHLYQAGAAADPAKTARYLVLAGDRAIEGAAFGEALRDYDLAAALQPAGDRAARADLVYKRGLARRSLGRWEEALADWREAADAYERLGDTEAAAQIFNSMCYQLSWGLRYSEVLELSQRGLAMLGGRDSANRCRFLGYAGITLSLAGYYSAADAMLRRALALAKKLGDDGLQGGQLLAVAVHHLAYQQYRETAEAGLKGVELLRRTGQLWYLGDALFWTGWALFYTGRLEDAAGQWRELAPLAARLGHTVRVGDDYGESAIANLLRTADIDAYEAFFRQSLERARSRQHSVFISQSQVFLGVAYFWTGRWQEALDSFEEAAKIAPAGAFFGFARSTVLLARAYMGERDAALAVLRQDGSSAAPQPEGRPASASLLRPMIRAARSSGLGFRGLLGLIRESRSMRTRSLLPRPGRPNTIGSWSVLFAAVEGLAVLGERSEAAKLYPLVLEGMKTGTLFRIYDARLLDTLAGIAAGAGGNWVQAEEHFRTALRRSDELPHVLEQPEARRWYARMLLDRSAPGDRETARRLLTEAIGMYRKIGMPKHVEMAEALLREAGE